MAKQKFYTLSFIACFALSALSTPIDCAHNPRQIKLTVGHHSPESEISAGFAEIPVKMTLPDGPNETPKIQVTNADDEEIWKDFESWVKDLVRIPPGKRVSLRDLYIERLVKKGLPKKEVNRRLDRIDRMRAQALDRERVYWDGKHKLGDSPSEPLKHVRNAVRNLNPGKALDVAMGNGRHAIFLATLGWDATGYDFSSESVHAALALAANAGVTITAVQATHDTFDFGESLWDLIIVTYPYYETMDLSWPSRLWRAVKAGGLVVFQGVVDEEITQSDFIELWQPFVLAHCEIIDKGEDWFEGRKSRTVKLIAHKKKSK
jgi:SAM-dependent methyltransferase